MEGLQAKRWRRALRRLGLPAVRSKLQHADAERSPDAELRGVVADHPHPSGRFVDTWYREAIRRKHRRSGIRRDLVLYAVLGLILVGLVAVILGYV